MDTFTIPKTIEQATADLNGIGALLTAKKWARAAIVYAFTEPQQGKRNFDGNPTRLTISDFAKLGITGLTNREDVGYYRKAWQTVIDDGQAKPAEPGRKVTLPDRAWPPSPRTRDVRDVVESTIRNNPDKLAEILVETMATNPEPLADAIAEQDTYLVVEREVREGNARKREQRPAVSQGHERDYGDDLRASVNKLMPALHAMRDGQWEPDTMERTLLTFIGRIISELVDGQVNTTVFDEIEAFLSTEARS